MSEPAAAVLASVSDALGAFQHAVRPLSHSRALEEAFTGYFAFKAAHPDEVRKPFLYFVDYGLPSTTPRGYVFDMNSLKIVDGPFTVAHGRGSSVKKYGVPTRFSNAPGSAATSLGLSRRRRDLQLSRTCQRSRLQLARAQAHGSVGRLQRQCSCTSCGGARCAIRDADPRRKKRRVSRDGAVSRTQASPTLANGGMVFLFAPESDWMAQDPWLTVSAE